MFYTSDSGQHYPYIVGCLIIYYILSDSRGSDHTLSQNSRYSTTECIYLSFTDGTFWTAHCNLTFYHLKDTRHIKPLAMLDCFSIYPAVIHIVVTWLQQQQPVSFLCELSRPGASLLPGFNPLTRTPLSLNACWFPLFSTHNAASVDSSSLPPGPGPYRQACFSLGAAVPQPEPPKSSLQGYLQWVKTTVLARYVLSQWHACLAQHIKACSVAAPCISCEMTWMTVYHC